jgi:SpoVK/Ycf46/Vps4 family AAA+-type ATPase
VLTSNSRSRFDSAFTRRLDAILDFPQPTPQERRALWVGHLGTRHAITDSELNRLATACDLSGGHVRNIVLAAAARARHAGRPIDYADALHAVAAECRKLGQQAPPGLHAG